MKIHKKQQMVSEGGNESINGIETGLVGLPAELELQLGWHSPEEMAQCTGDLNKLGHSPFASLCRVLAQPVQTLHLKHAHLLGQSLPVMFELLGAFASARTTSTFRTRISKHLLLFLCLILLCTRPKEATSTFLLDGKRCHFTQV